MGMRHKRCPQCGKSRRYDNGCKGDLDPRARTATWSRHPQLGLICYYCTIRQRGADVDDNDTGDELVS